LEESLAEDRLLKKLALIQKHNEGLLDLVSVKEKGFGKTKSVDVAVRREVRVSAQRAIVDKYKPDSSFQLKVQKLNVDLEHKDIPVQKHLASTHSEN